MGVVNRAKLAGIVLASAMIGFTVVWLVLDVRRTHRELEQASIDRNNLLIRITDLQSRVDAQLELDRREEERLKLADERSDRELYLPGGNITVDEMQASMWKWEDAGRPMMRWDDTRKHWYSSDGGEDLFVDAGY